MKKLLVFCLLSLIVNTGYADEVAPKVSLFGRFKTKVENVFVDFDTRSVYKAYGDESYKFIEKVFVTELDREMKQWKIRLFKAGSIISGAGVGLLGIKCVHEPKKKSGDELDGGEEHAELKKPVEPVRLSGWSKAFSVSRSVVALAALSVSPYVMYKLWGLPKKIVYKKVLKDFLYHKYLYEEKIPGELRELLDSIDLTSEEFDAVAIVETIRTGVYENFAPRYDHRLKLADAPKEKKEKSKISRSTALRWAVLMTAAGAFLYGAGRGGGEVIKNLGDNGRDIFESFGRNVENIVKSFTGLFGENTVEPEPEPVPEPAVTTEFIDEGDGNFFSDSD